MSFVVNQVYFAIFCLILLASCQEGADEESGQVSDSGLPTESFEEKKVHLPQSLEKRTWVAFLEEDAGSSKMMRNYLQENNVEFSISYWKGYIIFYIEKSAGNLARYRLVVKSIPDSLKDSEKVFSFDKPDK